MKTDNKIPLSRFLELAFAIANCDSKELYKAIDQILHKIHSVKSWISEKELIEGAFSDLSILDNLLSISQDSTDTQEDENKLTLGNLYTKGCFSISYIRSSELFKNQGSTLELRLMISFCSLEEWFPFELMPTIPSDGVELSIGTEDSHSFPVALLGASWEWNEYMSLEDFFKCLKISLDNLGGSIEDLCRLTDFIVSSQVKDLK